MKRKQEEERSLKNIQKELDLERKEREFAERFAGKER
jgi:hypothetical protein